MAIIYIRKTKRFFKLNIEAWNNVINMVATVRSCNYFKSYYNMTSRYIYGNTRIYIIPQFIINWHNIQEMEHIFVHAILLITGLAT